MTGPDRASLLVVTSGDSPVIGTLLDKWFYKLGHKREEEEGDIRCHKGW